MGSFPGVAIWATLLVRLKGVLVENSTPLRLKENGPPSWGDFDVHVSMVWGIIKESPASIFIAFKTSES